jgi:membrane protease YdiL (CAAX protease family)
MLVEAVLSAILNVVLLAGLPFLVYYGYHRRRHKRSFREIVQRAGLQLGERRYVGYCLLVAVVFVAGLILRPPALESSVQEGSGFQVFDGLGLGPLSIVMALLYGIVKTGFAEELLFRGLIAGSLSRRLPIVWANLIQACIFLVPHALVLFVMPEMWVALPFIFLGSLFAGWARIRSDSIVGPWLIHSSVNVAMALSVAIRSAT